MLPITDTHAHLDDAAYDADREEALGRARAAGVARVIAIGIGEASIAKTLALAEKHEGVFAAVGVHPNDLGALPPGRWDLLERAARHARAVAVGETGLDYFRLGSADPASEKRAQRESFLRHLDLARRVDKPVVIHCREALEDTLAVLREFGRFRAEPGVMHCFAGTPAQAEAFYGLGYAISVGGILTFKNAPVLREVARAAPRDRVMLETDCPYLAPEPHRGKRNEPARARLVAEKLAGIWEEPLETTVDRVALTVRRVFGIQ
jgi:TatD DNase family protein